MITCYLVYEIDPAKLSDFERYSRFWLEAVPEFGGVHHGYWLPHEGASDEAVALFSFQSLAAYEDYRRRSKDDPRCQEMFRFAEQTGCIRRYKRNFLRPLAPEGSGRPAQT